jgi:hypothetical protein
MVAVAGNRALHMACACLMQQLFCLAGLWQQQASAYMARLA